MVLSKGKYKIHNLFTISYLIFGTEGLHIALQAKMSCITLISRSSHLNLLHYIHYIFCSYFLVHISVYELHSWASYTLYTEIYPSSYEISLQISRVEYVAGLYLCFQLYLGLYKLKKRLVLLLQSNSSSQLPRFLPSSLQLGFMQVTIDFDYY